MNGAAHRAVTIAASIGILAIGAYAELEMKVTASAAIGCLLGTVVHPDLDQAESRKSLWSYVWRPYGYLVPHRSWVSHFPVISTLIRCAYLLGIVFGIMWLLEPRIGKIPWPSILNIYALAGLIYSDFLHIVADVISTAIKRLN